MLRERNLAVNDDVELAGASGLYLHRTPSSRIKPRLHTEGVGFVVSDGAVKDHDRHDDDSSGDCTERPGLDKVVFNRFEHKPAANGWTSREAAAGELKPPSSAHRHSLA